MPIVLYHLIHQYSDEIHPLEYNNLHLLEYVFVYQKKMNIDRAKCEAMIQIWKYLKVPDGDVQDILDAIGSLSLKWNAHIESRIEELRTKHEYPKKKERNLKYFYRIAPHLQADTEDEYEHKWLKIRHRFAHTNETRIAVSLMSAPDYIHFSITKKNNNNDNNDNNDEGMYNITLQSISEFDTYMDTFNATIDELLHKNQEYMWYFSIAPLHFGNQTVNVTVSNQNQEKIIELAFCEHIDLQCQKEQYFLNIYGCDGVTNPDYLKNNEAYKQILRILNNKLIIMPNGKKEEFSHINIHKKLDRYWLRFWFETGVWLRDNNIDHCSQLILDLPMK